MVKKGLLWIIMLLGLLVTSFFSETTASLAKEAAWKADWDQTVAAGKQEGKITIYTTSGPSTTGPLRQAFERAYGINLEFVVGRGAELREKLLRERRTGLYLVDIFMMGASGLILDLKPQGVLEPLKTKLILPEVVDTDAWYGGVDHLWVDKQQTYVLAFAFTPHGYIVVNTDLVKPGDIKVYTDLLHPRWKGKIVLNDPTTTGSGQQWFQMTSKALGYGFMHQLAKQEPLVLRDLRQQVEWIARGKYDLVLGANPAQVAEFIKVGAPLTYLWPTDAMWAGASSGTLSLINRSAHPHAAKVFINWLLTKEAQTIFSKAYLIQSARLDVPTGHLDPGMVRQRGVVYLNASHEDIYLELPSAVKEAKNIFGPRTSR